MFGNSFINPYMATPYYQATNMTRGLGGLASTSNLGNTASLGTASGIGKGLLSKFSFSGLLNGASKTLNIVNQAIPIFYQVKPMFNNAKTMLKIMGAVKGDNSSNKINTKSNTNTESSKQNIKVNETVSVNESNFLEENPKFFI